MLIFESMKKIKPILILIAILYAILFMDWLLPIKINSFGLIPRTQFGLVGIFTSPFLHGNLAHLNSNAVPLSVMLIALIAFYDKKVWKIVLGVTVLSGGLLWCFGQEANHIGASGLIYGLASFLVINGILERNFKSILISIVIAVAYSGMVYGLTPFTTKSGISWDGHLFGAISGILMSYFLSRRSSKTN